MGRIKEALEERAIARRRTRRERLGRERLDGMTYSDSAKRWALLIAGVVAFFVAAAGLFAYSLFVYLDYPEGWTTTEGEVIELRYDSSELAGTRIRFTDNQQRLHVFESSYGDSGTELGEWVDVSYDPSDPEGTAENPVDRKEPLIIGVGALYVATIAVIGVGALGIGELRHRRRGQP